VECGSVDTVGKPVDKPVVQHFPNGDNAVDSRGPEEATRRSLEPIHFSLLTNASVPRLGLTTEPYAAIHLR
jgi:hypothetical protein